MRIGLAGVGTMGSAMAARLATMHDVATFDAAPAAQERLRTLHIPVAASLAEVAAHAEIVLLSLPGPSQVTECVTELLAEGGERLQVIVDTSTVDPATTVAMAQSAQQHGVGYLDAPILGRPHRCGNWTLPVGGTAEALAAARPALEMLASTIVPMGAAGSGHVLKLLNNLMLGAINAITCETMAAAVQLGLDPDLYQRTIAASGAASVSGLFTEIAPKIAAGDTTPTFTLDLMTKDNRLAVEMIAAAGLDPVVGRAVLAQDQAGQAAGLGALDSSALVGVTGSAAGAAASTQR